MESSVEKRNQNGDDIVILKNFGTTLAINPKRGCEISSLVYNGIEIIHRALDFTIPKDGEWYGHGQLLFPAVGRSKDGIYTFPDENAPSRTMPIHGFLMNSSFEEKNIGIDEQGSYATYIYKHSGTDNFPFPFTLEINYRVTNNGVVFVNHTIINTSTDKDGLLPFGIGNHITLKYPFEPDQQGATWSEGRLLSTVTHEHLLTSGSLLSGELELRPDFQSSSALSITTPCATNGVFGFNTSSTSSEGLGICSLMVVQPRSISVEICHTVVSESLDTEALSNILRNRHFVLWGEAPKEGEKAGFICPEPWLSGPDSLNTRKGLVVLKVNQSLQWNFSIAISGGK